MRSATTRSGGIVKVLLLAVLAPFAPVASAGPGVWTSGGPWGGNISALAIDPANPSTLYCGSYSIGVLKSVDSGSTWTAASSGLTDRAVRRLAIDPVNSATLYAGTENGGVFKSTDSGGTWAAVNTGLTERSVSALTIVPSTPSTLYAGTEGGGVFKSTDSGGTWTPASTGLTSANVYALAIDPTVPATLYAGTSAGGVFKSTDSGSNWAAASTGLTDRDVFALVIDPASPATLYAGTYGGGVFQSTDSGGTWTAKNAGLTTLPVFALLIDPTSPATLYAAHYGGGVFKSADFGNTWASASAGLTNRNVYTLVIDPATPARLYSGTWGGGVFVTTDSAGAWAAASSGLPTNVVSLVINPASRSTVYAATFETRVFKSTDSGGTWTVSSTGLAGRYGCALAIDPVTPATLYAGTYVDGVFKSIDSGSTWNAVNTGLTNVSVEALAIDPATPSTLYAGSGGRGVFKSTNSGATWDSASAGLTNLDVYALAVDPVTPATLYAGTILPGGIFRSVDSGTTWAAASTGLSAKGVRTLVIDPSHPSTLYAGTDNAGVFRSTDSGNTWIAVNRGLTNLAVRSLVVDPSVPGSLYAGTDAGGLFRSTDSGGTWAPAYAGLPSAPVTALALDAAGVTTLYAGLLGGGVWQASPPPVAPPTSLLLPSSARSHGLGGAFYATDLTVANTGAAPTTFVVKFLGNNGDGRGGPEKGFSIAAGASTVLSDVLGSVFDRTSDFGAIRVTSPSDSVRVLGQTSTPGFGGTFGQSVPAARPEDLVTGGTPRSILAVREDASFRTNLILANASEAPLEVYVTLVADTGISPPLASRRYELPPLGMTQVTRVVRELGVTANISGARLVVSTPSSSGRFAAYASVIDNVTNDPRTLLPIGPIASNMFSPAFWILPSSARTSGAGGAFYTTDLTVAYTNDVSAHYGLKFLGHDKDGRGGAETTFDLGAGKSATYADVLGSVFHKTSDYGAIRISSRYPYSDAGFLAVLAQTSTPGFGGTFGQSVPAATAADLIRSGTERSILAVREDDSFRTNLILANATEADLDVDVRLVSADGADLATKRYSLLPLGMTQVTKVVRDLGVATNVAGARIVLSTPTANGAFAAYASVIDNVTNDPRTLLPR